MRLTRAQSHAITALVRAYRRGERAALLQLPTGQGKSQVAVRVFRTLRKAAPLKLLIVTPNQGELSRGWRRALRDDDWVYPEGPIRLFSRTYDMCRRRAASPAPSLRRRYQWCLRT